MIKWRIESLKREGWVGILGRMWPDSEETLRLLESAREGDAGARGRLLERHRDALRRMVGIRMDRALQRRVDESDVVQDVLIEADRRLKEYLEAAPMPFLAWLRNIARDRMIDAHRRHRVAGRRSLDRETHIAQSDLSNQSAVDLANLLFDRQMTPAAAATHHELEVRFQNALETLDEVDQEIVLMRHFEQLSNQQTAEALQLSEPAASMRYLRAMRRLRALLDDVPAERGS
jgi:RNA polymerase sigma-70 factor, ECF subfamily